MSAARSNSQARKTSFSIETNRQVGVGDESFKSALQDGEQPAKVIKIFDNSNNFMSMSTLTPNSPSHDAIQPPTGTTISRTNNCSHSLVLSQAPAMTTTTTTANQILSAKVILNKSGGGSIMSFNAQSRRLSGSVAEMSILPNQVAHLYGAERTTSNDAAAAFFHANGKLTLLNGGDGSGCVNETILLKATTDQRSSTLSRNESNVAMRLTPTTATAAALNFTSLAPMVAASAETSVVAAAPTMPFASNSDNNFAQLLAAATASAGNTRPARSASVERRNSKVIT